MGNSCFALDRGVQTSSLGSVLFIHSAATGHRGSHSPYRRRSTTVVAISRKSSRNESVDTNASGTPTNCFFLSALCEHDKELIKAFWRDVVHGRGQKDLFHRTMLYCIQSSKSLNEIIACEQYCYRDLTKWPKLNRICEAQFAFFERLIIEFELDAEKMREACIGLGEMHAQFAQYGLKAHFLHMFQEKLLAIIARLHFPDKVETCIAFTHLTSFVVDLMISSYSRKCAQMRQQEGAKEQRKHSLSIKYAH